MREIKNMYKILLQNLEGKRPLGVLGSDGRILLKQVLEKKGGRVRTGFNWLKIGSSQDNFMFHKVWRILD
jgi:hypothetical protein